MMKIILLLLLSSIFYACSTEQQTSSQNKENSSEELSFEQKVKREIESKLKINAAEDYHLEIIEEYIDRDTIKDAIITVNRKQYALENAEKKGKTKFLEHMGNTGLHNHVFVYLAGSDKFLQAPPVGSSIYHPLKVYFESITTPSQQDFWVEYRTRNSMYRNYYTVRNNKIYLTFNCPVFDEIGETEPIAYAIKHSESSVRLSKDIALYHGKIPNYNPENIEDVNNFTPSTILSTDELYVFFIFDDKDMVFKTPFRKEEKENEVKNQ